jgi:hypothetical protein
MSFNSKIEAGLRFFKQMGSNHHLLILCFIWKEFMYLQVWMHATVCCKPQHAIYSSSKTQEVEHTPWIRGALDRFLAILSPCPQVG